MGTNMIINKYFTPKKSIKELVNTMNKSCPKKYKDGIILDSISIINNDFNYYFTLIYEDKEKWNNSEFEIYMKPILINLYQKSNEKKILDDYKFNLVYNYRDGFFQPISKIKITPIEYQK